jgi:serine/threonine-protein kinase
MRIIKLALLALAAILIAGSGAYFTLTTLIRGEETVIVPDLLGKDVVWVLELLTDLGLNTKVSGSEYSNDTPKNQILTQRPAPGTEIKRGRDVKIILSKGPKILYTPDFKGISLQRAKLIVEEHDLILGNISSTFNSLVPKDNIVSQAPVFGDKITRGKRIDLLVSRGPRPPASMMPLLTGLPLEESLYTIEKQALILGKIQTETKADMDTDIVMVIAQNPVAGERVVAGTVIDITLNQGNVTKQAQRETDRAALFRYRLENGFLKRHVRVRINRSGFSYNYVDALMDPGHELLLMIPQDRHSTLFLYIDGKLVETRVYG